MVPASVALSSPPPRNTSSAPAITAAAGMHGELAPGLAVDERQGVIAGAQLGKNAIERGEAAQVDQHVIIEPAQMQHQVVGDPLEGADHGGAVFHLEGAGADLGYFQ